jgi:hypothetical protein
MLAKPAATQRRLRPLGEVRALFRRIFVLAVAAVVLAATIGAGRTYLFCTMMQERVDRCCCTPERDEADLTPSDAPSIEAGCCEDHATGALALGSTSPAGLDVPAGLPAAIEVPLVVSTAPPAPRFERQPAAAVLAASPIRAGPRTASDACVRLQVFRC